jgi:siroheme decarboxylase
MKNLTAAEKKVCVMIQKDLTVTRSPFETVADVCEMTEDEILRMIQQLRQNGFIRKFGAILRHQKAGYRENALVIWSVPQEKIEKTGNALASFPFVSHCYQREPAFMMQYNIFTMIHSGEKNISSLINEMSEAAGIDKYLILKSIKEYKKSSPEYF